MSTVLVTGASGYLGGWCVVKALQAGHDVRGTVRSLAKAEAVRAGIASQVTPEELSRLSLVEVDLLRDEGWFDAILGCDFVLHVASPLTADDEQAMVAVAREGTVRVLRNSVRAGVARVVLTSSAAAATPRPSSGIERVDETCWTDAADPDLPAYRRSKVLAEAAAWEFMAERGTTELVTVLPASILGPALAKESTSTLTIIKQLLTGALPVLPNMMLQVVDVRDVADCHLAAMTAPGLAGERFLASGELMGLREVAEVLRREVPELSGRVPRVRVPDVVMRTAARAVPMLRDLTPLLGRRLVHDSSKARRVLGWQARPAAETVVASARSLAALGELG